MTLRALLVLSVVLAVSACRSSQEQKEAPPGAAAVAPATPVAVTHEKKAPAGEDCGGEAPADPAAADKKTLTTDPTTGETVVAVGGKLAAAPVVKVADVLARPQEYAGKTIRLEGNVSAMCTHKRAWFALQSEDKSGAFVRIIGAPTFLVPEGSVGKKARTEGTVELVDVPAETQEHFAQEHQLDPAAAKAAGPRDGPQKTAVLKATGAEFI